MGIFSILAVPLGYIMQFLYNIFSNYGWAIIVFTILVRVAMFPLSLKQQKSMARQAAFAPMIQELQKKWANDRQRQQQEMMKFQEENGIKMSAGCAPMLVNMLVIFGIIAVIQAPLTYILHISQDQIQNGVAIVEHYDPTSEIGKNTYTMQSVLIGEVSKDGERFIMGFEKRLLDEDGNPRVDDDGNLVEPLRIVMNEESVQAISSFNFNFMGMNMSIRPNLKSFDRYLIMPILSLLTMFLSQFITMRSTGQTQGKGAMIMMTVFTGALFGFYAFTVPVGFSLYYTTSNVVMLIQQIIVRKIHNPEKIKEEILQEMEDRKKAKKSKKKIKMEDEAGNIVEQEISEADLAKIRLAKARELAEKKYSEEEDASTPVPENTASEAEPMNDEEGDGGQDMPETQNENAPLPSHSQREEKEEETSKEYKPGRRKRARQNKETQKQQEESSFVQQEREAEKSE